MGYNPNLDPTGATADMYDLAAEIRRERGLPDFFESCVMCGGSGVDQDENGSHTCGHCGGDGLTEQARLRRQAA